jgi:hypothetical protein
MPRVRHLSPERRSGELPDGLGNAQMSAGGTSLSHRQLAARGVDRKAAADLETIGADEIGSRAFVAKAKPLELQHIDHRIVVVGFEKIDIRRTDPRLRV